MAELDWILRTTFSGREFADRPVADVDVAALLDAARFASSGGNRQGWRVVAARDGRLRAALIDASLPYARRYAAQRARGEQPYSMLAATAVTDAEVAAVPEEAMAWYAGLADAPVILVIGLDLRVAAAMDKDLDRAGIVAGASIYPFVHNILLSARDRGMTGVLTTFGAGAEPAIQRLVGFPPEIALCSLVPIGYPVRTPTKLSRRPVESFARWDRWDGEPIHAPAGGNPRQP
jgi:nitroreductase